ncbi:MAG: hypothetical protein ACLGHW_01295 [Gammaproteobacteria bacterium]
MLRSRARKIKDAGAGLRDPARSGDADGTRCDALAAAAAALVAHAAFALMLIRAPETRPPAGDRYPLEVVFIQWLPPPGQPTDRSPSPVAPGPTRPAPGTGKLVVQEATSRPQVSAAAVQAPPAPVHATDADDRWHSPARLQPRPGEDFHRDPFQRPPADPLAAPEPSRFRLRRDRTPEDVVKGVAQFVGLWPPGYTTDPCPALRRSVSSLSQESDAASRRQLEMELDRERRHCR